MLIAASGSAQCGIQSILWPTFQVQFLAKNAEKAQIFVCLQPLEKLIVGHKCGHIPHCVHLVFVPSAERKILSHTLKTQNSLIDREPNKLPHFSQVALKMRIFFQPHTCFDRTEFIRTFFRQNARVQKLILAFRGKFCKKLQMHFFVVIRN